MGDSAQEQSNNEPVEMDETMEKIEQGKRLLALRKYSEAADLFGQLAQDLTQKHDSDSLHPELAPVWFLYGQALFQLATSQAPLLGPSIAEDEKESAPADSKSLLLY